MNLEMNNKLYCTHCGSTDVEVLAWTKPNNKHSFVSEYGDYADEDDCWCNKCEEHYPLATLPTLWQMFSNVEVDENDNISSEFLNFPVGTSKFDVWRWFDEQCPNNLHDDLLYPKQ